MGLNVRNNVSMRSLRHLSQSEQSLARSLERLSSGQKINKASDSPAGLIISENLRAQVAGIEQAISNSEFTISMLQTAEGALTEVNNLLIQARQLSLAAANEGGNDENSLLALQEQLRNALQSIDRVSANTRFGEKQLLDGSRGIAGIANGEDLAFVTATERTQSSPIEGYEIEVTQLAQKASVSSDFEDNQVDGLKLTLTEGGRSVVVVASEDDNAESFAQRLKEQVSAANLKLDIDYSKGAEVLSVTHRDFGSENSFTVTSTVSSVLAEKTDIPVLINNGQDIAGTINGETSVGQGDVLVGNNNNRTSDGLAVRYTGKEIGIVGSVSVAQNALTFQIGPNRDQTVRVAIDDTSTAALARGIDNSSGFESLSELDITSVQGAEDSLLFLDEAINKVASVRGRLGAFQKNALESNVATLRVASENLIAAESSIRDTDVARELAEFTKYKILTEAAAASSAIANNLTHTTSRLIDRSLI